MIGTVIRRVHPGLFSGIRVGERGEASFSGKDLSRGRRDIVFDETDVSPEPPPPMLLRKAGEKDF